MFEEVEASGTKSIAAFEKFVAPALTVAFGAKVIRSTERHENQLEKILDRLAGIDGVLVDEHGWTLSFSSRIQFGRNYGAFTIRRSRPNGTPTEWQKLKNPTSMKPTFHIHSFVADNEKSAIVGIAPTVSLLRHIYQNPYQWRSTANGETFYFAPFGQVDDVQVFAVDEAGRVEKILGGNEL